MKRRSPTIDKIGLLIREFLFTYRLSSDFRKVVINAIASKHRKNG
jgi:hypothetical protein